MAGNAPLIHHCHNALFIDPVKYHNQNLDWIEWLVHRSGSSLGLLLCPSGNGKQQTQLQHEKSQRVSESHRHLAQASAKLVPFYAGPNTHTAKSRGRAAKLALHHLFEPGTFDNRYATVGGDILQFLHNPGRPANFHAICRFVGTQTEMSRSSAR
jgi:hypothetical protein